MGDMNARTASFAEKHIEPSSDHQNISIEIDNHTIPINARRNCDSVINYHGKKVIEFCNTYNLKILNGRSKGDPLGNFTYYDEKLGASVVDYSICNQDFYGHIENVMTLPQNELSDHCKIVTVIKGYIFDDTTVKDTYNWKDLPINIHWNDDTKTVFTNYLLKAENELNEINQRIDAGLINSTGKLIQDLFQKAAYSSNPQINQNISTSKNTTIKKPKRYSKLWFDVDCNKMKLEVRKVGREKQRNPANLFLREIYTKKIKEYRSICHSRRFNFWKEKFALIENSLTDSKQFWENWKNCSETPSTRSKSTIAELFVTHPTHS